MRHRPFYAYRTTGQTQQASVHGGQRDGRGRKNIGGQLPDAHAAIVGAVLSMRAARHRQQRKHPTPPEPPHQSLRKPCSQRQAGGERGSDHARVVPLQRMREQGSLPGTAALGAAGMPRPQKARIYTPVSFVAVPGPGLLFKTAPGIHALRSLVLVSKVRGKVKETPCLLWLGFHHDYDCQLSHSCLTTAKNPKPFCFLETCASAPHAV